MARHHVEKFEMHMILCLRQHDVEGCISFSNPGADTGGVDRVDIHPPFFSKKKFEMSLYLK